MTQNENEIFMISSKTDPSSLAGAISSKMREQIAGGGFGSVILQAIGAGAINQGVKAIAIARGHLAPSGLSIVGYPSFVDLVIGEEPRTGIRFNLWAETH